jgi:hypothetical protein
MVGMAAAAAAFAVHLAYSRRAARLARERSDASVQVESDDSFPASDPPSHTPTTGATAGPTTIH